MPTETDEPFGCRATDYYNEPWTAAAITQVVVFFSFVYGLPVTAGCLHYVFGDDVSGWEAVLVGAGMGTVALYTLVIAGVFYRARVRRLKGKPLEVGERILVTHGKYRGKHGIVSSMPQGYPFALHVVLDEPPDGKIRSIDWAHLDRLIESSTPPASPSP